MGYRQPQRENDDWARAARGAQEHVRSRVERTWRGGGLWGDIRYVAGGVARRVRRILRRGRRSPSGGPAA